MFLGQCRIDNPLPPHDENYILDFCFPDWIMVSPSLKVYAIIHELLHIIPLDVPRDDSFRGKLLSHSEIFDTYVDDVFQKYYYRCMDIPLKIAIDDVLDGEKRFILEHHGIYGNVKRICSREALEQSWKTTMKRLAKIKFGKEIREPMPFDNKAW